MAIVITPQGEYIDTETGNPVMNPMDMQRLDPRSVVREGEMARENIPSNMDMGMDSMMPEMKMDRDTLLEIDFLMKRFNLSMDQAVEAAAMTKDTAIRPEEFGGQQMPAQQQQAPMPQQMPMARPPMPSSGMGALPSAPPPRPVNSMDADRTQSMEMQKYNMGT